MARLKSPPAPVSKTVQRLLAQIHAEAEAATLEALSAKDGIVVLQPLAERRLIRSCTSSGFVVYDGTGSELRFFMWRRQEGDRCHAPCRWTASRTLLDGQGREWQQSAGHDWFIDDFGTLVSQEEGAA